MPKYKPLYSLYKGLRENKYDVPDSYVSFQKTLTQPGNAGAKSRRGLYQSLKDSNYDVPDTYEDFYKNLFVPVNSTTSRALKIGENPNTPTVNRYRQKMFDSVDPNKNGLNALSHRAIGQAVRATNNVRKPVVAKVVNRKGKPTGEEFAITPAKTVEDLDREYAQETTKNWENELHDQMADADKDAAKISDMFKSFIGSTDEVGSVWGNLTRGGGIAGTPHSVTTNNGILENTEARQILAAGDYNRKRRELLQLEKDSRLSKDTSFLGGVKEAYNDIKNGEFSKAGKDLVYGAGFDDHSFWRGMYDAAKDTGFLTGGASDLINSGSLLATKQDLDKGIHTEAGDMLLQQAVKNSDAQSQYGDNQGWMYTGGIITTNMAPFMVQIGSAGFSKGMSNTIGKVVQGAASKVALGTMEKATGMVGAHIANYIGKVTGLTTKAFGKAIQYGIVGAAQANTVGLGNVANDVINRYTGQVYQDEQGNYKFGTFDSDGKLVHEGGEDFLTSLVKGEAAQTIEFATELAGGGIDAAGTALKNFVTKGGKKIINKYNMENVSKVIDFLLNNKVSKHARYLKAGADRTLGNVELNSIVGESLEEELGIIANTVFTGDNKISDLWDEKQQSQIWGGMLLSIGLMKGAVAPFHAYNAKQYYSYKHKLNKADVNLSQLLGKEKWDELRNKIDATTNKDMPELINKINRDVALGKNRQPVREYIQNLLIMRGYDIGNMLAAKKAVEDKGKGVSVKNMEKNQAYQQGRDAYGYDTHEIQLDQADKQKTLAQLLGITEQQLSTMSDEELDNLSGRDDNLDKAIYDYQLSTIRYQGVADNAQDQVDLAAQKAAQAVDMYTDKSRNTIRNATIKAAGGLEDYGVYVINGNIATHDDGSIDVGNSDDMILFYDPTTNTVEHADATRFAELGSEENADEVRNQAVADAKENAIKEITGIIDGVVEVGTQFKTIDADGTEHTYEVLADNGDGTAMITIDGNIPTQLVKGENVNVPVSFEELQKMKDASDQQRLQAAKAQREQMEKERAEQQMQAQTTQAENPAQENNTQSAPIEDNLDYSDIIREDGKVQMVDVFDKDGNNLFPDAKDVFYIQGNKMRTKFAYIDANGELKKQSFPTGLVKIKTRGEVSVDDYKKYRSMILSAESSAVPESSMIEDNSGAIEGDRGGIEVNDELPPVPDNVTINGDGTYSVDGAVQGGENTTAPAEQTEQTPAMTLEDGTIVPMLEDGNPDFSKLTADQTAELYDSQFGEDADSVISGWVSDAKKALDKANNMTVKGKNFVEQKAAKEAKEKAIADAQAAYDSAIAIRDAYNSRQLAKVEDDADGRKNLIEKARRKFSRLKSAVKDDAEAVSQLYKDIVGSLLHRLYDGTGIDVTDTIPLTAEEYVASNLGAHSLNYEGTETSKGVKQETGLSREDFAKTQLLAADGKGTTIDNLVHSLWENRPSNLESLDTQDIRNALIGLLNSGFKASEARNYIENLRIAQAENILEEQKKAADNAAFAEEQNETALESEEKTGEDNSDEINDEENEQTNAPEQNKFPDKLREGSKAIEVPDDATEENPLGLQLSEDKVPFEIEGGKSGETYNINDNEDRQRLINDNKVDDKDILDIDMPKHVHKAIKELCKKMGLKVQFLYMGARSNGWIENGTMYLALDTEKATQFVFGHEMTHAIKQKNPEAYKELVKVAMAVTTRKKFEEDLAKVYQNYYGISGYNNVDDYVEEVVADNLGKFINDFDLAQKFSLRLNHPVLATILHAIQKIKSLLYGDFYKSVDALERIVEKAYVKTAKGEVTNSETGEDVSFSLRQKPEPKKKGIGYKVFVLKNGKLYPPMVANPDGAATPVGVWLDADAAPIAGESKTGRPQVKQGGKGTQGGSGKLAYRPGWHLGVVPYAIQFNRKDAEGNKTLFPKNFVFAEVEYAADVDYQEEARQEGINPSGKYQHSIAGLKHLPTDGYYMYRTNPNPETDPWVITGAMKVNRILTRAEQAELVKNAGREPQQIQKGDIVTDDVVNSINQEIADAPKFSLKDNQGNPLNQDGTLKLDKIKSIDELTDEDFLHPTRNVELPSLPKKIADAIGTEGKPVVIKKNIFERNYMRHKDVTPELSKVIFKSALYNPDLYGQNKKKTRPYNWVLINTKDEKGNNRTILLEVNPNKDNVEIVHWHFVDERGLKKIKKQADREDGQLLILPSNKEEVGALSDPTVNLTAAKIDNSSETAKENGEKVDSEGIKFSLKDEKIKSIAEKFGVNEDDVAMYANAVERGSTADAARARANIKRYLLQANEDKISSFKDIIKYTKPINEALKENFGDLDAMIEERRKQVEAERNAMEAARKRAQEEEEKRQKHLAELSLIPTDELDKRYMDAIANNDESTAREMLDESARRNGYGDVGSDYQGQGAWAAPSNPQYESDEARRADIENSPDVNLEDIALGYNLQPDDYFDNPRAYMNNTAYGLESAHVIKNALDAIKNGEKDVKVKVYRAVPTSVKEGKLRNGDWVTPSKKYAEMHGDNRLDGKYRIIEDEVPANQLWWDGNDANEFGFDDGKEYRYKNAKNNRKLNDLITYDNKGNVIPPSKRFNSRKSDIRFSLAGERGAAAADKAEERTARMDNLSVARKMEEEKKDAKAIKIATGWERGADGKWRFEIPDFHFNYEKWKDNNKELLDSMDDKDYRNIMRYEKEFYEDLSPIRKKNFDELRSRTGYKIKQELTLGDVLEGKGADTLFKYYPELRDVKFKFSNLGADTFGIYNNKTKTIEVNDALLYSPRKAERNLQHEVQHVIQHLEGFAKGGNQFQVRGEVKKKFSEVIKQIRQLRAEGKEDEAKAIVEKNRGLYNAYTKNDDYNSYKSLAGEVEARNVQERMNMTPEERRKTLAESTEDVARKDQIFLGVGDVSFSLRDMADGKESGVADMAEDLKSLNTPGEVDDAIKTAIEDMPSGWRMANKKMIHIAQALGENRKAEIAGEEPKFSLKDGSLIKAGTYFSGGGLVEEGLKGIIDPVVAVEYDEKISGVYRNNFGQHIVTADVRDVDPKELVKQIDGEVEYFHASPVCKNYSQAKSNHAEVELDKETAASTAEFINAVKPKVVTIENVKGYKDSEAMKIITDALDTNGYTWDADVYNAADYGGYTNRERLIVRAVRYGKLPAKPKKMAHKSGWYEAVEDIIPTLIEKKNGVAPWMDIRLKADGIDWRNIDKPLYVMGSAYADGKVPHAFADELLPTLRTKSGDVIVMPDGKVYRAMGRVLARVSGVSDDYKMPFSENLSHTIIGNGIPTQLTEHVIAPLLTGSDPKFSIRTYHGTGASFDKFDFSHMGEGEGSQAFGWGGYVTNSKDIAEDYTRRAKIRKDNGGFEFVTDMSANNKDMVRQYIYKHKDVNKGLDAMRKDLSSALEMFPDDDDLKELSDILAKKNEEIAVPDNIAYLYDVDIPDDNGDYLDWDAPLTDKQKNTIIKELRRLKIDFADFKKRGFSFDGSFGGNAYDFLMYALRKTKKWKDVNASRAVSKFLSSIGFTGIKYKAGTIFGGAKEGDTNYVIFDENNANIVGNTRFSLRGSTPYDKQMEEWKEKNHLDKDAAPMEKPIKQDNENIFDYMNRMVEWTRNQNLWKTAPKQTGFQDALAKWKADNGLSPDAYPPVRPHRENYSTEIGYTEDLEEYNKKKELWKSAPKPKDFDLSVDLEDMNKQLRNIRRAVLNQKNYDQRTVKAVSDLVRKMLNIGWGDGLSRGKVGNLLSAAKNATGANDVKKYLDKAMGILAENYLNRLSTAYDNLINTRGARADQSGVIKMGSLDAKGQAFMSEYKKAINMDDKSLNNYIANIEEDSAKNEDNVEMNDYRLAGIQAAIMYKQQIGGNDADIAELKRQIGELKNKKDATKEDKDLLKSLEKKLFENKFDRITMYENLLNNIQRMVKESKGRAKEFREEIAEHKNEILHRANLDLEGVDSAYYDTTTAKKKFVNNPILRFVMSSTYTFEQFLKFFGRHHANGEGYLYNYFMSEWQDAADEQQLYNEMNRNALDEKTKELFGKKNFTKLVGIDGKGMKEMDVEVTDYSNKETGKRTIHLKQGQMLYIYLVNKETDGEMKLRAMGITEEKVAEIEENLDPRVKAMGEWLQDEYLPECQRRYQSTHTKYFGAPMKEVENYFPLAINNRARNIREDLNQDTDAISRLAGTSTGAIITRRVNVIPLDIENADAFVVAFNHLDEMEEWSAYLPFIQDVNTLLSSTHFRNQVMNMSSAAYGSGKTLWEEFKKVAQIAAGTYKPKVDKGMMDSKIAAVVGGIATAKISGRLWTAFKQTQSATTFLTECDPARFLWYGVNPYGSWHWAYDNLPLFRKRVEQLTAGDVKVRQFLDELEKYHDWTKTIAKVGMSPNILVDSVTCAVGARSVYETELNKLTKLGYSKDKAEEKAIQKASLSYNKTQQSSEGAFLSPMQVDRTYVSAALSLYKNANYAYGRKKIEAIRGIAKTYRFWSEHKNAMIGSMTRQIMDEDGLDENVANAIAKRAYTRTFWYNIGTLLNYMTIVPISWAAYKVLLYLLNGDDDDKKKKMIEEACLKGFATTTFDDYVIPFASNVLNAGLNIEDGKIGFDTDVFKYQNLYINPATSDLSNIYSMIGNQKWWSAGNKFGMLGIQMLVGFNPETIGALYQAYDEFDKDSGNMPLEIKLAVLKSISAPEESIRGLYMDELGLDNEDRTKVPLSVLEQRYSERQINRDNLLSQIAMPKEIFDGYVEKYKKSFEKKIQDKMDKMDAYDQRKFDAIFDTTTDPALKGMMEKKRTKDANAAADEQIAKEGLNQEKKGKEPSEEAYDAVKMSIDVAEDNAISTYNKVLNKRYAAMNDEYNNQTDAMKYIFMSKHPNFKAYKDLKSEYTTYGKKIKELKEKLVSADGYDAKQTILKQIRAERDKFYELQSKVR